MAKTNLLPALGEGFKLIVREPLPVLAWGVVSLLAALIPTLLYFAIAGSELWDYYGEIARSAGSGAETVPTPPSFAATGLVQLLQWAAAIVSGAVVYSAVYRAVLRPDEKGFARMRFGMDEMNVGVVVVVLTVLMVIALIVATIVAMIPAIIIGVFMARADGGGMGLMALIPLLALLFVAGLALVFSRFAVALPMTFAERRIRVFEAWGFTKGYAGQLALIAFLQLLIIIGIYVAVIVVAAVAVAGSFMGLDPAELNAMSPQEGFQRFSGLIIVGVLFYVLLLFVMTPIMLAPWARAYQMIARDRMRDSAELFA